MSSNLLQIEMDAYKIRQLKDEEAYIYKKMRLEAIHEEPSMFRCSTPAETELTDAQWQERVKYPRAVFVLLYDDMPIGMTSILRLNDKEAYLGQSYIKKEHRAKGLPAILYKIRMEWAFKLSLKRLTVSHRESNMISKAAIQRLGFVFTHRETLHWLDGTTEDALYYVLDLER